MLNQVEVLIIYISIIGDIMSNNALQRTPLPITNYLILSTVTRLFGPNKWNSGMLKSMKFNKETQ